MNPHPSPASRDRTWLVIAAIATIPLAVLSAECVAWWWNHPAEPKGGRNVLVYSFPPDSKESLGVPVSDKVVKMLSCDHSLGGWIDGGDGRRISVNYFEWNNTEVTGLSDAFGHAPEVCMGVLGNKVQAFLPNRSFALDGYELVFDATQFHDESRKPLYVFKLSWANGMEGMNLLREGPNSAAARSFKFRALAQRWRPRYARVLMLGVYGAPDDDTAWKLLQGKVLKDITFNNVRF
jgi:hypothetical protein